jgi:hypothetical protein
LPGDTDTDTAINRASPPPPEYGEPHIATIAVVCESTTAISPPPGDTDSDTAINRASPPPPEYGEPHIATIAVVCESTMAVSPPSGDMTAISPLPGDTDTDTAINRASPPPPEYGEPHIATIAVVCESTMAVSPPSCDMMAISPSPGDTDTDTDTAINHASPPPPEYGEPHIATMMSPDNTVTDSETAQSHIVALDDGSYIISAETLAALGIGQCLDIVFSSESVVVYANPNLVDLSPCSVLDGPHALREANFEASDRDTDIGDDNDGPEYYNSDYVAEDAQHSDDDADDDTQHYDSDYVAEDEHNSDDGADDDTTGTTLGPSGIVQANEANQKQGTRWKRAQPEKWKRNVEKKMRMEKKKPKTVVCVGCHFKCTDNFTESDRQQLFTEYNSSDYACRKNFILANIEVRTIERPRTRNGADGSNAVDGKKSKKKGCSVKYFLRKDANKVRVCKRFFMSTINIGHYPITAAINGQGASGIFTGVDGRGRHYPGNKTKDTDLEIVRKHIDRFPRTPSHYTRSSTKREYLDQKLTIKKMYDLYLEHMAKTYPRKKAVKDHIYRRVFCTEFNLAFFKPKKDLCQLCSRYDQLTGTDKDDLLVEYNDHLVRKASCQNAKAEDKAAAIADGTNAKLVVTFDLQSVLQIPSTDVSPLYYSRKLSMFNLTIHNANEPHQAFCYCWPEIEGKRGSCEIGSCLYIYLKQLPKEISEITMYSDTCGGQNRNHQVAALLLYAVQTLKNIKVINQKFLESGHTEMEVDSMHSAIEREKRHTPVYSALDWHTIFKNARRHNPYTVVPMDYADFIDLKQLSSKLIKTTKHTDGSTLKWLKVKCFMFRKDSPGIIRYRYGHDGPYKELDVYGKTRTVKLPVKPPTLYENELPISKAKYTDLCKLLRQKGLIPKELRQWYLDIPHDGDVQDVTVEPAVEDSVDEDEISED